MRLADNLHATISSEFMSKHTTTIPKYPEDFLWGASTAGHQVEGHCDDQWTRWEKENAEQLAKDADARWGFLPQYEAIKKHANNPSNYLSGAGIDHYERYKEDFALLKKLGLNSFRFTIEWSRVEPEEGVFNAESLKHYQDYIDELVQMGIEPVLNIWHWTHPVWFEDKGAFTKRKNIKYFIRFVKKLAPLLEKVTWVVTINEPNNVVWFQYISGEWPPAQKNRYFKALRTYANLVTAHKKAFIEIKRINPSSEITTAHASSLNKPAKPNNLYHKLSAAFANYVANTWYLRRIRNYQDVVGFNFYFVNYMKGPRPGVDFANPKEPLNDLGWYMEPYAVADMIRELHKKFPHKRIILLENGLADREDKHREWWLNETIQALDDVIHEGIPVAGYLHWSLLDNFEWDKGWWPAFGLVEVDRENNMKRTIRNSAHTYTKAVRARS